MSDWRKGLLRLYFVACGLWALAYGMRIFSRFNAGVIDVPWGVFIGGAIVLPGALFFAYRWTLDGFFGHPAGG